MDSLFRGRPLAHHPHIPAPAPREVPVTEVLVHPGHPDTRPTMHQAAPHFKHPTFNKLYGSQRVEAGWTNTIDGYATGTLTTIAGTQVSTPIKLAVDPHWKLQGWPGGTSLYLCIRQFSIAPQTATFATLGSLDILYQDAIGGLIIPLGDILSNASQSSNPNVLIPASVTDPDVQSIGNLLVTLNSGATVGAYSWQMGFSAAYLLPAMPEGEKHERVDHYHHI